MNQYNILVLLSIILIASSFQIKNIKHQIPIQSSSQYSQYIQAMNGLVSSQSLNQNTKLSDIITNQRISLLNTIGDIVLVLVDQVKEDNQILPGLQDIKQLVKLNEFIGSFDIVSLVDFDQQKVNEKLSELQQAGKIIHTLEVSQQLAKQFNIHTQRRLEQIESQDSDLEEESSEIFEQSQKLIHKQQTVKVSSTKANPSYILKFFFAFLFIIVCIGSLSAITNMDNKKDTLLYAKFIADVGAR